MHDRDKSRDALRLDHIYNTYRIFRDILQCMSTLYLETYYKMSLYKLYTSRDQSQFIQLEMYLYDVSQLKIHIEMNDTDTSRDAL